MQKNSFAGKFLDDCVEAVKSIAVTENSLNPNPATSQKKAETILWIRSHWLKFFLLSLLAVISLAVAWKNAANNEGKDFYQFWVVGQCLDRPDIHIYSPDARNHVGAEFLLKAQQSGNTNLIAVANYRGWLQTYSTPFLYASFRFFSTGNYDTDLRNYRLLMLAALAVGIFIFFRLLKQPWTLAVLTFAVLLVWFDPLASDLYVGNVNSLQFGALAIYLWIVTRMRWQFRDVVGGAILGLTLVFKPNLIFVAIALAACWIVRGNFRRLWFQAVGGIVGGVLAIFFSAVSFHNFRCWREWFSSLHTLSADNIIAVSNGNFSPVQIVYERFHLNIALPLAIVLTALVVWSLWKRRKDSQLSANEPADMPPEIFAVAIGCLLTAVASRLTWFHYYTLTIPAFIFLLPAATVRKPSPGFILKQIPFVLALAALTPIPALAVALDTNGQAVLAASAGLLLFFAAIFLSGSQQAKKN